MGVVHLPACVEGGGDVTGSAIGGDALGVASGEEGEVVLAVGEAANVGGSVGGGGLLDEDAGGGEKGLGKGAAGGDN